jgi:hypothetical protein
MKKLMLICWLVFSCSEGSNKKDRETIKARVIAHELSRWQGRTTPENFIFSELNDSTFTLSSEFVHPMLKKEVEFTHRYYFTASLDSIKSSDLIKRRTKLNGNWSLDFDLSN